MDFFITRLKLVKSLSIILSALIGAIFLPFFASKTSFAQQKVILQKFSSDNGTDWFQIYNPTNNNIDLGNYVVRDSTDSNKRDGFVCLLEPGGYFSDSFGYSLNKGGDTLRLYQGDKLIDCVCYGDDGTVCPDKSSCELSDIVPGEYGIRDVSILTWSITGDSSQSNDSSCIEITVTPTLIPPDEDFDHSLFITEIMPNPEGADDSDKPDGEWVEIHNPDKLDLNGFRLKDESEHWLTVENSNKETYQDGLYWVVYRNGDNSFSLNNGGDTVYLYLKEQQLDSVSYSSATENKTWAKVGGSWCLSDPHKGEENHECWQEGGDKDEEPSPTPCITSSPTPTENLGEVLGSSVSAEATESSHSAIGFYDLVESIFSPGEDSISSPSGTMLNKVLPGALFSSSFILSGLGIGIYWWKKRRSNYK